MQIQFAVNPLVIFINFSGNGVIDDRTQPEVEASDGVTAKKIQNVYVYCQYITRTS